MKLICEQCGKPCYLSFPDTKTPIPDYCPFGGGAVWVELKKKSIKDNE